MKEMTLPNRLFTILTHVLDAFLQPEQSSTTSNSGKEPDLDKRRKVNRKDFSCYMQVINHDTHELVGHLADISSGRL